ncbi:type II toxin-antitoxin system PemK/MazF family toxin [Lederbergia ruris]|uniref:Uncharacterized protein n=1 Tax=Lederbergia ruris TaxID=217495 RepID=A0ABQ4KEZ3_9BACI|nr:type II toxin-antitoxin system PemK/MazF family toxin [Lederbergia ruris]GIN55951.1 hypothetical protein J8TS2_02700 [Lederbergia ruris]
MKPGDIYSFEFPFEEGQGGKERPVLVFVLTSTPNEFIGLKITRTQRKQNRVKIDYWKEAGLDYESYVQCDRYSVFQCIGKVVFKGTLKKPDYNKVLKKFNEFYPILDWMNQE